MSSESSATPLIRSSAWNSLPGKRSSCARYDSPLLCFSAKESLSNPIRQNSPSLEKTPRCPASVIWRMCDSGAIQERRYRVHRRQKRDSAVFRRARLDRHGNSLTARGVCPEEGFGRLVSGEQQSGFWKEV